MLKALLTLETIVVITIVIIIFESLRRLRNEFIGKILLGLIALGIAILILVLTAHFAHARDLGQWQMVDPQTRDWYQSLMQPDNPAVSCCGEADAYFCDDFRFEDGKALCTVSDDRPDEPRNRKHIDIGTVIEIPDHKLKWDRGNPTGHGVAFLSRGLYVFCYVQPGGV